MQNIFYLFSEKQKFKRVRFVAVIYVSEFLQKLEGIHPLSKLPCCGSLNVRLLGNTSTQCSWVGTEFIVQLYDLQTYTRSRTFFSA